MFRFSASALSVVLLLVLSNPFHVFLVPDADDTGTDTQTPWRFRESTGETDEKKAGNFLKRRLKEVGANQLGLHKFTTSKNEKLTLHELLEALKKDFALRGKLSPQNKSGLVRTEADFGHFRALALTAEHIDAYAQKRLEAQDRPDDQPHHSTSRASLPLSD